MSCALGGCKMAAAAPPVAMDPHQPRHASDGVGQHGRPRHRMKRRLLSWMSWPKTGRSDDVDVPCVDEERMGGQAGKHYDPLAAPPPLTMAVAPFTLNRYASGNVPCWARWVGAFSRPWSTALCVGVPTAERRQLSAARRRERQSSGSVLRVATKFVTDHVAMTAILASNSIDSGCFA